MKGAHHSSLAVQMRLQAFVALRTILLDSLGVPRIRRASTGHKKFQQNHCVVLSFILRSINEGHAAFGCLISNHRKKLPFFLEFVSVADLKFPPFVRLVIEPPPQFRAGRDVL